MSIADRRTPDQDAEDSERFEERSRVLYFDTFGELSHDGRLPDPHMHAALEEGVFYETPENVHIDAKEVFRLVGEYHQSSSLNLERRTTLDLRLAKYVRECVERHLGRLIDAKLGVYA